MKSPSGFWVFICCSLLLAGGIGFAGENDETVNPSAHALNAEGKILRDENDQPLKVVNLEDALKFLNSTTVTREFLSALKEGDFDRLLDTIGMQNLGRLNELSEIERKRVIKALGLSRPLLDDLNIWLTHKKEVEDLKRNATREKAKAMLKALSDYAKPLTKDEKGKPEAALGNYFFSLEGGQVVMIDRQFMETLEQASKPRSTRSEAEKELPASLDAILFTPNPSGGFDFANIGPAVQAGSLAEVLQNPNLPADRTVGQTKTHRMGSSDDGKKVGRILLTPEHQIILQNMKEEDLYTFTWDSNQLQSRPEGKKE